MLVSVLFGRRVGCCGRRGRAPRECKDPAGEAEVLQVLLYRRLDALAVVRAVARVEHEVEMQIVAFDARILNEPREPDAPAGYRIPHARGRRLQHRDRV